MDKFLSMYKFVDQLRNYLLYQLKWRTISMQKFTLLQCGLIPSADGILGVLEGLGEGMYPNKKLLKGKNL